MATAGTSDQVKPGQPSIPETQPEPRPQRLPLGPLKTVHVYWLAGMSCDGCSIAVTGATNPGIEGLLLGTVPAMPKVILHHPVLSVEAGDALRAVVQGRRGRQAGRPVRRRVRGLGRRRADRAAHRRLLLARWAWRRSAARRTRRGPHPVPTATWLQRLAPGAAATIAIGTCATWGGVPVGRGQSDRRDERDGFSRQGLPQRVRPARDQHPRLRAGRRQLHRDGLRDPAVPPGARPAAGVRRARPSGVAVRRDRAPGLHARRLLRGGHVRARSTAIPSAWSRSAAGARSSTATSSSAARSITWAAA